MASLSMLFQFLMYEWKIGQFIQALVLLKNSIFKVFNSTFLFFSAEGLAALPMTSGGHLSEPIILTVKVKHQDFLGVPLL